MPLCVNGYDLFQKKKPNKNQKNKTQANVEQMIYGKQDCLEYKYRQAAYLLLMVLCFLGE